MPSKVELIQGDCLEVMKSIQAGSVDLILCDLPYGTTQHPDDRRIPFAPLWEQYKRVIKSNGAILLFGQGVFYADLVASNKEWFRYDLIWNKMLTTGFLNANRMPLRVHETIAVFYRCLPAYFPQFVDGNPLHSRGKTYKQKIHKNQNYGQFSMTDDTRAGSTKKYPTSILSFQKPHPSVSRHRTEKSIDLLRWLILTYTKPGDLVLDNCMGSGTTGVACVQTGRNFIGIEIDPNYFAIAQKRIATAQQIMNQEVSE